MNNSLRFLFLISLPAVPVTVLAQGMYLDVYVQPSSDNTYIYSTSVLQYKPPSPCTGMCLTATHTYQEAAKVVSPSGRTASNSTGQQNLQGSSSENIQAEAYLAINGEAGQYTAQGTPYMYCSVMGLILSGVNPISEYITIAFGKTFTATSPYPNDGPLCPQIPACANGTTARCPVSGVTVKGVDCAQYYYTPFLIVNGVCEGYLDTVSIPTPTKGLCQ